MKIRALHENLETYTEQIPGSNQKRTRIQSGSL